MESNSPLPSFGEVLAWVAGHFLRRLLALAAVFILLVLGAILSGCAREPARPFPPPWPPAAIPATYVTAPLPPFGDPANLATYGTPGASGIVELARCKTDVMGTYAQEPAERSRALRHCYDLLPADVRERVWEVDQRIWPPTYCGWCDRSRYTWRRKQ